MGVVLKRLKRYLVVYNIEKRLQASAPTSKSRHRSVLDTNHRQDHQNHHAAQAIIPIICIIPLMMGMDVRSLGRPNSDHGNHPDAQQDHLMQPPWAPVHTMIHALCLPNSAEELQARGAHGAITPMITTAIMATTQATITTIPIHTIGNGMDRTTMMMTGNMLHGSTHHGRTTSTTMMIGRKANRHRCHHHGMKEGGKIKIIDMGHGQLWTAPPTRPTTTRMACFNTQNIMTEFTTNRKDRPGMRSR